MIITQTPLRISLLGGNTDFPEYYLKHGGLVLTTTIDKYIYCIVKKRFDDLIIVNWTIKETVKEVNDLKHELVRESLKLLGITKGIEISFLSDIPTKGTGLGSSSSVTVGVLNALHNYLGESVTPMQLAGEAIEIEVDVLKKPIGVQDQYAVALGGLRLIEFKSSGAIKLGSPGVKSQNLYLDGSVGEDFNNSLMLLYTGVSRKSEGVLSTLNIKDNTELLHQNKKFAFEGIKALMEGNLKKVGRLLGKYWDLKKTLSDKISNSEIEKMYQLAKEGGAIGGKVIGAGGGGFLLVMFPANKRAAIRNKLKDYQELPFRTGRSGSKVIFNV